MKDPAKPLWLARTKDDNKMIVIKYVEKYGEVAHKLCADQGLAPKLLYVSQPLPGEYTLVVMEYVELPTLYQALHDILDRPGVPQKVYNCVEDAITKVLHPQGLVFADLREPNILVDGHKAIAMLVDFDWSGKVEVDKYPISINMDID